MAPFTLETQVLRFRLPHVEWTKGPRWILWPVWAWRVVAPQPRTRRLNIFQKAALGLCRAGRVRAEEIGERLLFGTDLAARILDELQGQGWLDHLGRLTPRGVKMLDEEENEPLDEQKVGWTFTDPFTGEVWPRFQAGELPHAETEANARGFPVLLSGSPGDPRRDDAFAVLPRPDDVVTSRPRAEDILRAVRLHRKQHAWEEELEAAPAPHLRRISFVSDQPTPYLIAARAWCGPAADWRVDDPFGIGDSSRLRRWLEERFDVQPALRQWLAAVAGGDVESDDLQSLKQKAAWDVEERMTIAIRSKEALYVRLVAMQRALLETAVADSPPDKWDDVAVKAQRAAERLMQDVCRAYPPRTRLARDVAMNELLLDSLAAGAGFQTPLPPTLVKVRMGKVMHAERSGSGSLRPLVLLALLGTAGLPDHPLARAAREAPDLLHRLDALASVRDDAAHEASDPRRLPLAPDGPRARINAAVETVFLAANLLLK